MTGGGPFTADSIAAALGQVNAVQTPMQKLRADPQIVALVAMAAALGVQLHTSIVTDTLILGFRGSLWIHGQQIF